MRLRRLTIGALAALCLTGLIACGQGAAPAPPRQPSDARFDLKAFHDRVLEDGGVPLTCLREKIRAWVVP